jgi:predicted Zn-dependent peptidase
MFEIVNVNNSKLIFSNFDNIETASIGIFFRVGSRFEKKSLKGIAHFLEHMVFKGSRNYSHLKIKREIEGRGGALNAFTSQEITAYYANILNKNILSTLDILLDMSYHPLLLAKEVNKERNVILEEIKMYNDLPSSRVAVLLDKMLWPKHPLGEEVIGYNKTVKNIDSNDLVSFCKGNYVPANMVVSFSGNFNREKIVKAIDKKIKHNTTPSKKHLLRPQHLQGVSISVEKKNLEQTHLCLGFRSFSTEIKKQLSSKLLNIILGANMSSRLFEELREKRSLCYDVSTEVRKYRDSGAFIIHTGLDGKSVPLALTTIFKVLDSLRKKGVRGAELSRAKDYSLGQTAMMLERPQGRMFYLAEQYLMTDKILEFRKVKEHLADITPLDIQMSAQTLFRKQGLCLSCVGDVDGGMNKKIRSIIKGYL